MVDDIGAELPLHILARSCCAFALAAGVPGKKPDEDDDVEPNKL
jgi:hypothetical protein